MRCKLSLRGDFIPPTPPPPHTHTHTIHCQPSAAKGTPAYLDTYRDEWREVFLISVELYAFGSIVYLFLASGKKQYWADGWPTRNRGDSVETPVISKETADMIPSEKTKLLIQHQSDDYILVNY